MRKVIFAALALMCPLFVACNKNDQAPETSGDPQVQDTTPDSSMLSFHFLFTEDMINYTSSELRFDNGEGDVKTVTPKKEEIKKFEGTSLYTYGLTLSSSKLPATFTLHRKLLLPNDISGLASFNYESGFSYQFALYNAGGQQVFLGKSQIKSSALNSITGEMLLKLFNNGRTEKTVTITIEKNGTAKVVDSRDN